MGNWKVQWRTKVVQYMIEIFGIRSDVEFYRQQLKKPDFIHDLYLYIFHMEGKSHNKSRKKLYKKLLVNFINSNQFLSIINNFHESTEKSLTAVHSSENVPYSGILSDVSVQGTVMPDGTPVDITSSISVQNVKEEQSVPMHLESHDVVCIPLPHPPVDDTSMDYVQSYEVVCTSLPHSHLEDTSMDSVESYEVECTPLSHNPLRDLSIDSFDIVCDTNDDVETLSVMSSPVESDLSLNLTKSAPSVKPGTLPVKPGTPPVEPGTPPVKLGISDTPVTGRHVKRRVVDQSHNMWLFSPASTAIASPVKRLCLTPIQKAQSFSHKAIINKQVKKRQQFQKPFRTFELEKQELSDIYDYEKYTLKRDYYKNMLRNKLKNVGIKCIIFFRQVNSGQIISVYAYTIDDDGARVELKIQMPNLFHPKSSLKNSKKVTATVYVLPGTSTPHFKHSVKRTIPLIGKERDAVKRRLLEKRPGAVRAEDIRKECRENIQHGNLGSIKFSGTYRQVGYEQRAEHDDHKDDIIDMEVKREKHGDYVYRVQRNPFRTILCSNMQLEVLQKQVKWVMYLDSTGSVVRRPNDISKEVYYYAGVIKYKTTIVPVTEMVSAEHTIPVIADWLFNTDMFGSVRNCRLLSRIDRIVTDNSAAMMRGVLNAFLKVHTITDYINDCYDYLYNETDNENKPFKHELVLTLCCSHFMKNVSKNVSSYVKDDRVAIQIKKWIASLFDMTRHVDVENWFRSFAIVMMSKGKTRDVMSAIDSLNKYYNNCSNDLSGVFDDPPNIVDEEEEPLHKNKFVSHYRQIQAEVYACIQNDTNSCSYDNAYCNEEYLNFFIKSCITFLPMWTCVMLQRAGIHDTSRLSNNPVETWFNITKNNVFKGELRQKCGRFVTKMRLRVEAQCIAIIENIPPTRCPRSKKQRAPVCPKNRRVLFHPSTRNNIDMEALAKEKWLRRPRRSQHKYLIPTDPKIFLKKKPESTATTDKSVTKPDDHVIVTPPCKIADSTPPLSIAEATTPLSIAEATPPLSIPDDTPPLNITDDVIESYNITADNVSVRVSEIMQRPFEKYANFVIKDLELYKIYVPPDTGSRTPQDDEKWEHLRRIIVCYYNGSHMLERSLTYQEYVSLFDKQWLYGDVIDAALYCLKLKYKVRDTVTLINSYQTEALVKPHGIYFDSLRTFSIKRNSVLLGPVCIGTTHWVLLHLDMKRRTFAVYDPMDCTSDKHSKQYFELFKESCVRNELCSSHEIFNDVRISIDSKLTKQFPDQVDGYNCGVLVIYYASIILGHKPEQSYFNPAEYRVYLQNELLRTSASMYDICAQCGGENDSEHEIDHDKWVGCDACKYWWHINCIPQKIRRSFQSYDIQNRQYCCLRCRFFLGLPDTLSEVSKHQPQTVTPVGIVSNKPSAITKTSRYQTLCEYPLQYLYTMALSSSKDPGAFLRSTFGKIPKESLERIQKATVLQRASSEWYEYRKYRITASNFHEVLHRKNKEDKYETKSYWARILNFNSNDVTTSAMRYGIIHESDAMADSKLEINKCGLFVHDSGVLAASPDGMTQDGECVEVKCPYSARNMDLKKFCNIQKAYIVRYDETNDAYIVNKKHSYYNQIQGQIYITGVDKVILIIWNQKSCIKLNIMKDIEWASNVDWLVQYYYSKCVPYIVKHMKDNKK